MPSTRQVLIRVNDLSQEEGRAAGFFLLRRLYLAAYHEDMLSLHCSASPATSMVFLCDLYETSISSAFTNQDCIVEVERG